MNAALVSFVAGALRIYEQRYAWATEADYERAYNAFAELQASMANNCLLDLVESNNRIYRLLDAALNGTQYTSSPNPADPARPLVEPAIPAAPATGTPTAAAALRAQIARLWQLSENAATGFEVDVPAIEGGVTLDFDGSWRARLQAVQGTTGGFFGIGATPVTLADLTKAGRVNSDADQGLINDSIEEILGAVSSGANIGNVITNLLEGAADVATDGGVIAATLATAVANAALAGSLAGQLDRLIRALDGGGLTPPATNVLDELGDVKTLLS